MIDRQEKGTNRQLLSNEEMSTLHVRSELLATKEWKRIDLAKHYISNAINPIQLVQLALLACTRTVPDACSY